MRGHVLNRILQALVVMVLVSMIVFALLHVLPGDPVRSLLGPKATATQVAAFSHANGYDRPLPVQYLVWLKTVVLHGDLGYSYTRNQPVRSLLGEYLPKTALLVGLSTLIAVLIAVVLGVLQAARHNGVTDHAITAFSFFFYSVPDFFLAQVLIVIFAANLTVFPAEAPQGSVAYVLEHPLGLVLPVLTLTLVTLALFSRYVRASMVENMSQDYVRTARALGASNVEILYHHALRNALIPIATLVGLSLPWMVSGAVVTEAVFNYPGAGQLFWNAAQSRDFPVLIGLSLVVGFLTVLGSLLADLLYAVLDPRVRRAAV